MSRPARALVNAQALRHNFQQVKRRAPGARVMAVVKANAYGHGLEWVATLLHDADAFAVASVEEGIQLREAGLAQPICLLTGFFGADELLLVEGYKLSPVIHNETQLKQLTKYKSRRPVDVWIKVDTGMHRIGFGVEQLNEVYRKLEKCNAVSDIRMMSHFPCADDRKNRITGKQTRLFLESTGALDGEKSLANSAAIVAWPDSHLDWVRPGLMLYGASPMSGETAGKLKLKPVMTLKSELIAVHDFKKNDAVGYGSEWVCPKDMTVGVVAIGYGDGYPRHASEGTPVLIGKKRVPLIGRVSMDMITVDLRQASKARVGDSVVLWGDGLPVEEVADSSGTLAYELFCQVTARVARAVQ